MASPPPPPPPARPSALGGLTRSGDDRVVGGVAAGIAGRLGVDPLLVRVAFVVLAAAGGAGAVLYGVLWALLPTDDADRADRMDARPITTQQAVALGLIGLGSLLLLRELGLWLGDNLVWPIVLVAVGSAVVWMRSDEDGPLRRAARSTARPDGRLVTAVATPSSPLRIVVGGLLAFGGVAGFLAANVTLAAVRDLALTLGAATVGIGLLLGPWLWRLGDQLAAERRERIRQEERAELAAHLHDSVLQTLALIQRSADQPRRMVTLARRQERELRGWLYDGGTAAVPGSLKAAAQALTEEVETVHAVEVELVVVGDAPLDDRTRALLGAVREACVNAAKHAGTDGVDVYVEAEADRVLAFVRDRGRGFDPGRVDPDRRGIRDSIVGRLARHDGTARVISEPGGGTEVEMAVPRTDRAAHADADAGAGSGES